MSKQKSGQSSMIFEFTLYVIYNASASFQGLGRNFLRHLRRTRLLVHVVDAAAEDPVADYRIVKEVCFF